MSSALILNNHKTDDYSFQFIGRQGALDAFHSLRSLREQKNALYLEADGGFGKTKVLEEYVLQAEKQRRPWHVRPAGSTIEQPIIDFYDFQNRSVAGLRRSIVARVGTGFFPNFTLRDLDLQEMESKSSGDAATALSLRLEVERLFFDDFKRALRQLRTYTVLIFDTYEVVYNRHVGRWFLQEFLGNPGTAGCLVVFAGRRRNFDIPLNTYKYELGRFSEKEMEDYFRTKFNIVKGTPEYVASTLSQGIPLMIELLVYYAREMNGRFEDLLGKRPSEIQRLIISRFLSPDKAIYEVIQDMAILKRRYNRSIYERRRPRYVNASDYETIASELRKLPFVKYRRHTDSFTLHDRFQEMMIEHGGSDLTGILADEVYDEIVYRWYESAIKQASNLVERGLLQAEQLAYILDDKKQPERGIALYKRYFEEIKSRRLFEVNDLLWGEMAEHLSHDAESLNLTREQANWLFENGHYDEAGLAFGKATSDEFASVQSEQFKVRDTIRLGHCLLRIGDVNQAEKVLENGKLWAATKNNLGDQALFEYNLGHVWFRKGKWDQALNTYELALEHTRQSGKTNQLGQILFVLARLHARQGESKRALLELDRGLALINHISRGTIEQAQAFVFAGDIHRYTGNVDAAQGYYQQAERILTSIGGWDDWKAQARSGLGATFNIAGMLNRTYWGNIGEAIRLQAQAFNLLGESLNIVREYKLQSILMFVLDRMADVYVEVDEIASQVQGSDLAVTTAELKNRMASMNFIEEKDWTYGLRERDKPFNSLDTLGQAQRLYEIAFLHSDKMREPHLVFDSLVGAAAVAQRRGRMSDLEHYATLANTLHGLDDPLQERIFFSLLKVLRAHLEFTSNPDLAANIYAESMVKLYKAGGFGWYLARRQLPEIHRRLISLPKQDAFACSQTLSHKWEEIPDLAAFVEGLKDILGATPTI